MQRLGERMKVRGIVTGTTLCTTFKFTKSRIHNRLVTEYCLIFSEKNYSLKMSGRLNQIESCKTRTNCEFFLMILSQESLKSTSKTGKFIYKTRHWKSLSKYLWIVASIETLTHFSPMSHFYIPWKHQKTIGFLTVSGGIEMWHWTKMG